MTRIQSMNAIRALGSTMISEVGAVSMSHAAGSAIPASAARNAASPSCSFAPAVTTPSYHRGFAARGTPILAPVQGDITLEQRKQRFEQMLYLEPRSLELQESLWKDDSARKLVNNFGSTLGSRLHKFVTSFSDATRWKSGHGIHLAIKRQSFQFEDMIPMFGLPDTFFSKFQLMGLHMWLVCRRLRTEGAEGKKLVDKTHFIWLKDNEWLVYYEGVRVRFQQTMQGLENNFYGLAIACDCALDKIPNTTVGLTQPESLEDAIYRNVCQKQGDRRAAELLAQYCRRELDCLARTPTQAIMEGRFKFSEEFRPVEEQATESMMYSENKGIVQFALERMGLKPPTQLEKVTQQVTLKNVGGSGQAPQS